MSLIRVNEAGLGFRSPHRRDVLGAPARVPWLEIHSENYLCAGGARLGELEALASRYALSFHGVGLSLGSAGGVDRAHLQAIKGLIDRFAPMLVSEHVAWCENDGAYLSDLLPLPYSAEALGIVARNVEKTQEILKRTILIENPSAYVAFADSIIPEAEFISEIARRTGCGILLDVNNLYVTTSNLGGSAQAWLNALRGDAVGEIHLAGHARATLGGETVLIDDHGSRVADPVWALYADVLARLGPRPTLIEWDTGLPAFDILLGEARAAQFYLDGAKGPQAVRHAG